jgi:hypothetical protein
VLCSLEYVIILVAYRAKSLILYALATSYVWIDLTNTVYKQGKCDGILSNHYDDDIVDEMIPYWISYKVINAVPAISMSCYICINLIGYIIKIYKTFMSVGKNEK